MKTTTLIAVLLLAPGIALAGAWTCSTEGQPWQERTFAWGAASTNEEVLAISGTEPGVTFRAWGTCFNELDYDAIQLLKPSERDAIMRGLFAPDGDLRFTRGRLSMNANDYSRGWYSCDDVDGDFALKHFNIERDKAAVIPLVKMAQKHNPALTFWMSPWSPPAWMKINKDYPVLSSRFNRQPKAKDALLYGAGTDVDPDEMKFLGPGKGNFPQRLAVRNYLIQEPAYLACYAEMFGKFIDLYAREGVTIDTVMYQNEAYSYTPYPGCPWTAEGTVRFNRDCLAPFLKKNHPKVRLWLGTFNTNRGDYILKIAEAEGLMDVIDGFGFQWEGRQALPEIRRRFPGKRYMCSESECGRGTFDWKAGEHTFWLLFENLGNGVDEYYIWNFILAGGGVSPWGWRQNALVQVDAKARTFRLTPEYYAVKHFSNAVAPGAQMVGYRPWTKGLEAIVFRGPDGRFVVVVGNWEAKARAISVRIGARHLNATLPPHSFNTFTD